MSNVRDFPPHDYSRLKRLYGFMFDLAKEMYEKWHGYGTSEGMLFTDVIKALEDIILKGAMFNADKK
jgi:hypothetical protein